MKEFKTIKEFYNAVKNGDIDESKLEITLDNDTIGFYVENKEHEENYEQIKIQESNGYCDIKPLYKLLFSKSKVQWC